MLGFHRGSCHCVCLVAEYVRNMSVFLILALPSVMVNVVSEGVAVEVVANIYVLATDTLSSVRMLTIKPLLFKVTHRQSTPIHQNELN